MLPIALALAAKFAPDIISYMTNNSTAGAVAEKVIGIAQDVTGYSDPESAAAAIERSPEMTEAFRQAVMANDTELQRLFLADVANARSRDVEIVKATGKTNMRANLMLAATYTGLIGCVAVMLLKNVDANTAIGGALMFLLGKFSGNWEAAFNFEFGSSHSSQAKDKTISDLSRK